MNISRAACGRVWSIILAGGDGERLRPLIQRWLGCHKPKQYCAFIGTRSMLQHTLDRADRLTAPARRFMICAREHQHEALLQLNGRQPGTLILQPAKRGTLAGIFLPLMYVRKSDPEATVVIFPRIILSILKTVSSMYCSGRLGRPNGSRTEWSSSALLLAARSRSTAGSGLARLSTGRSGAVCVLSRRSWKSRASRKPTQHGTRGRCGIR